MALQVGLPGMPPKQRHARSDVYHAADWPQKRAFHIYTSKQNNTVLVVRIRLRERVPKEERSQAIGSMANQMISTAPCKIMLTWSGENPLGCANWAEKLEPEG